MAYPTPTSRWKLQDDADPASTVVVAANGSNMALQGGDNTSDKSTTGPGGALTKAFTFNGTDDMCYYSTRAGSTTTFTVCAWVKVSEATTSKTIFAEYDASGSATVDQRLWFSMRNTGLVRLYMKLSTTVYDIFSTSSYATADTWQHIAVTYDGGSNTVYFYFDGVEESPGSGTIPSSINDSASAAQTIGNRENGTTWFPGDMADVVLFNSVLTEAQIQEVMAEGESGPSIPILAAYYQKMRKD